MEKGGAICKLVTSMYFYNVKIMKTFAVKVQISDQHCYLYIVNERIINLFAGI